MLVFRRKPLPDARGCRHTSTEKPHAFKSRVKSGNFHRDGVDLLTDNPDSHGSETARSLPPFVAR